MDSRVDISLIIVSYNTRELTLDCLRSVYAQTRDVTFEVLVVDNASSDGSAASIAADFPQVRLFALDRNLGFAAANNFAAQHAQGVWLLLLNPDTVVLDCALDRLVAFGRQQQKRDEAYGIFGGRTLRADGSLDPTSCWGRPTLWSTFCLATGLSAAFPQSPWAFSEELRGWHRDSVRLVDIVTGCLLLLRRSLWEHLGGFDPDFFMYGEEADLCLRARRHGVRCLIFPDATIIHYGGASDTVRGDRMVRLLTARVQLYRKHWHPAKACVAVALLRVWAFTRVCVYRALCSIHLRYTEPWQVWRQVWLSYPQWSNPCTKPKHS